LSRKFHSSTAAMNPTSSNKITGFSLLSPSVVAKDKDNLSVDAAYHSHIEMMQRAGIATKLPMKTINTAIMIFLRYFAANDICDENQDYPVSDICRCCLFTAAKTEETPCRLRDIMNATLKITFPNQRLMIPNTTVWQQWKESLLKLESIILNEINFEFNAVHPHQFVLHQCNELKCSVNIAKMSWSICNDCMFSRHIMLSYKPHQISAAAIYVAAEFIANSPHLIMFHDEDEGHSNCTSPRYTQPPSPRYTQPHSQQMVYDGTKESNWWRRFDIDDMVLEKICTLIMDLYESPFVKFEREDGGKRECAGNLNHSTNTKTNVRGNGKGNGQSKEEDQEEYDEDDDLMHRTPSPKTSGILKK